ncbi:MAG: energy transducer TonB [Oligoflexia bacterium]|nr:energy transducer TonB [Oligoflexia bacterium]
MQAYARKRFDELDALLWRGMLISLLVHAIFLLVFLSRRPVAPQAPAFSIDVEYEVPKPAPVLEKLPSQIISEPESPVAPPKVDTKLLAEREHSAPQEKIRRGDAPDAGQQIGKSAHQPSSAAPAQLKQLTLDRSTLLKEFGRESAEESRERNSNDPLSPPAFSRPAGSGAAFVGRAGLNDYIPFLPDGDITLLNAKADQFAVFVRRVATQVFGQLRASGWDSLRANDIDAIQTFTTVRAILSPTGELLRVELLESSRSQRFDSTLVDAAKRGARDQNPPAGARAEDGTIRFIFRSKSWVRYSVAAKNGAPIERRWLLLATGLE